jgi:outer membrane protein TolC
MRVLNILTILLISNAILLSNEKNGSFDGYISDIKQKQFNFDYQKSEAEGSKLRDSWIAPIKLNYSYIRSNQLDKRDSNHAAAIRINQPIFKSGGIYYGIKFAQHSKKYTDYSIDVAKRKLIKDAISILMQIKQIDLKIKKQKLQIKNSEINLKSKKEQYLSGQLDSGFLDNAIIERNFVIQTLYDFETSKERLINTFSTLSDLDYNTTTIPHLELLDEKQFLEQNIVIKKANSLSKKDMYAKDMIISKYLPTIDFIGGYNWNKHNSYDQPLRSEKNYYDYGISATIPLDINTLRDIESYRVSYLKSILVARDKKRELTALFKQVIQNIENFEKKKLLSLENKDIYFKLLNDTKDLFVAGYKTEYDVQTLQNSVKISELNSRIYEIDKQLELLTLYEMYVNE